MVRVETAAPTAGLDVVAHSEQKSMPQLTTTLHECKSYRSGMFRSSYHKYEHDLKRHTERGWQLISCTVAGRDIFARVWLTATYER